MLTRKRWECKIFRFFSSFAGTFHAKFSVALTPSVHPGVSLSPARLLISFHLPIPYRLSPFPPNSTSASFAVSSVPPLSPSHLKQSEILPSCDIKVYICTYIYIYFPWIHFDSYIWTEINIEIKLYSWEMPFCERNAAVNDITCHSCAHSWWLL